MGNKDIINYYKDCKQDYQLLWRLEKVWGMHYGYWEKGDKSHSGSILKHNQQIIDRTDINKDSYVLEVGCGYCGTAMYIAERLKCKIEAITIIEEQVETSKRVIKEKGLDKYINVSNQDFHKTNFADNTFDIIYSIESVCYGDKKKFLKEAYRLLKPGGTLIINDGYNTKEKEEYTEVEANIMQKWNNGWAVKSLETANFFKKTSEEIGFKTTEFIDITKNVMKTSKFLYLSSFPAVFVDVVGRLLKIRTKYNKGNVEAARYQYLGIKRGLWKYGIFIAKK